MVCSAHDREVKHMPGFVRKKEQQSPLGRPRCRWEDRKIDLKSRMRGRGLDLPFLRHAQVARYREKR